MKASENEFEINSVHQSVPFNKAIARVFKKNKRGGWASQGGEKVYFNREIPHDFLWYITAEKLHEINISGLKFRGQYISK